MVGLLGQVQEGLPDTQAMLKVPSQGEREGKGVREGDSAAPLHMLPCVIVDGFRREGGELGTFHCEHVQKGEMRDCWGRNLSKGDGIYPLQPTSTLPKLCSELENFSPAKGKVKGQSPLCCQRAYWVVGLCYSPQRVTHRQAKGIQALQNQ